MARQAHGRVPPHPPYLPSGSLWTASHRVLRVRWALVELSAYGHTPGPVIPALLGRDAKTPPGVISFHSRDKIVHARDEPFAVERTWRLHSAIALLESAPRATAPASPIKHSRYSHEFEHCHSKRCDDDKVIKPSRLVRVYDLQGCQHRDRQDKSQDGQEKNVSRNVIRRIPPEILHSPGKSSRANPMPHSKIQTTRV